MEVIIISFLIELGIMQLNYYNNITIKLNNIFIKNFVNTYGGIIYGLNYNNVSIYNNNLFESNSALYGG